MFGPDTLMRVQRLDKFSKLEVLRTVCIKPICNYNALKKAVRTSILISRQCLTIPSLKHGFFSVKISKLASFQ